ncbi:PRA1 family protein F2 [Cardamine amara subsp. amara]|uniref:PRA1 family protein n=1 Tax=Cardamine amara subsp. amara TaxID=228776 RepID=A0ABD1BZ13_CARAN
MMNNGSSPTSTNPSPVIDLETISHAKRHVKAGLATRRPWRVMFDFHSMGLTRGISDSFSRIKKNLGYFQMNYTIVVLFVLFLSLMRHSSLIVFSVLAFVWIFLYFLRDEPLMIFRFQIDDQTVLICLSMITIVLLLFTHATMSIVGATLIGAVPVLIHAVVRKTEDLYLDEEEATTTETSGMTSETSSEIH